MKAKKAVRFAGRVAAAGAGVAGVSYAACIAFAWLRYGHPKHPSAEERDWLLDRFMPLYEVVERHSSHVRAPASTTFFAACETGLEDSAIVRAVFRTRELVLGSKPIHGDRPRGLLALTKSLGWGVLAEEPRREVVMGAVTQPWEADVLFRALPGHEFGAFHDPGFVKIAWTLRVEPTGSE